MNPLAFAEPLVFSCLFSIIANSSLLVLEALSTGHIAIFGKNLTQILISHIEGLLG
jgi:hypothetical protein